MKRRNVGKKLRYGCVTLWGLSALLALCLPAQPARAEEVVSDKTNTTAIYVGNKTKTASGNTLTINNSVAGGAVAGSTIPEEMLSAGTAITSSDAETIETGTTGTVTGNTLTLNNTKEGSSPLVSNWLAGGLAMTKTVNQNQVNVNLPNAQRVSYPVGITNDVFGGFTVTGDATNNIATLTGVSSLGGDNDDHVAQNFYGGYSYTGTVSDNTVNINGGKFGGTIYGGAQGVLNNQYNLPQSMNDYFSQYAEGLSFTSTGDVKNNKVFITAGGNQSQFGNNGTVYGGLIEANLPTAGNTTKFGNVYDNTVTISGTGMANKVYGGAFITSSSENGDALQMGSVTYNHVDILDGGYGEVVAGGYYAINGTTVADLENNSVTVDGGTIGDSVYGAYLSVSSGTYTGTGTVANNSVTLTKGTLSGSTYADAVHVYGGYANGGEGNNVTVKNNTVTIDDSTLGSSIVDYVELLGGRSDYYALQNNTLTVSNSEIPTDGSVSTIAMAGANALYDYVDESLSGIVSGNTANLQNNKIVTNYGGQIILAGGINASYGKAWYGTKNADSNTLTMTGNTVGTVADADDETGSKNYIAGGIAVGQADDNDKTLVPVKATGNTATLTNNTIGTNTADNNYVAGGMVTVDGDAESNTLTITGGTIEGNKSYVTGGMSIEKGNADSNTLTISAVTIGTLGGSKTYVAGGYAVTGNASQNTATITGATLGTDEGAKVYVAGGSSDKKGNAEGNTLTLSGTKFGTGNKAYVAGGFASQGNVTDNTLTFSANTMAGASGAKAYIAGGWADKSGTASGNTLNFLSGTVGMVADSQPYVAGGYTKKGDATGNTLNLAGGSIATAPGDEEDEEEPSGIAYITGGHTESGNASGNRAAISGGSLGSLTGGTTYVAGGYTAKGGDANENTLTISGGEIAAVSGTTAYVASGYSAAGNANGNTLILSGGKFGAASAAASALSQGTATDLTTLSNYLAGGSAVTGEASNNTVNLEGSPLQTTYSLFGGLGQTSTGNTLNVSSLDNRVGNLDYFQVMNYNVPEGSVKGDTLLTVTGTANLTNVPVTAKLLARTPLNPGEFITLVTNPNGLQLSGTTYGMAADTAQTIDAGLVTRPAEVKQQGTTSLVVTPVDAKIGTISQDTKLIPEARAAALNFIAAGADTTLDAGFRAATQAAADSESKKSFTPYVTVGGQNLRFDTGSYVDSNGWAGNLGLVRRIPNANSIDTIIPFAEYGKGNYTSHLENGARGDGTQHYGGVGLLLRRDLNNGVYYQASARVGVLDGDFRGVLEGYRSTYDTNARYAGASLWLGRIYQQTDKDSLDVYGRFNYTHLASDTVTLHNTIGDAVFNLDAADSYRTRLGARWTHNYQENQSYYAGLGWDYEFDSTARATYLTFSTPSPESKGSSALLELGWKSDSTKDNPWGADLRLTGWAGKQRGVVFNATVTRRL